MSQQIPEHYELYVAFIGLTAFVPRTERLANGGGEIVTRTTAILPRVVHGDPEAGYKTATGTDLPTHHAKLKLVVGGVQGEAQPTPYTPTDKAIQEALALAGIQPRVWKIDRQAIAFHPPMPSSEVTTVLRTLRGHGDPFPFDRLEMSDTNWLSSIREIFETAQGTQPPTNPATVGKIDRLCLTGSPPRVDARIELPRGGCLASLGLVEHEKRVLRYGYKCLHSGSTCKVGLDRAISQNVVLRLPIYDPQGQGLTLKSESLDGGPTWEVTLTPEQLFGRSKIILVVDHQPVSHNRLVAHGPTDPVEHFEVFYELSSSKPDMKDRPVPQASSMKGKRSMGVILPGAGELDGLSRKSTFLQFGKSLAKIKLARAVVSALKKDTGQICPNSKFEPEPY